MHTWYNCGWVTAMKDETGDSRPALVGRQREAALLWSRFETAIRGRCDVTCVTGEPGYAFPYRAFPAAQFFRSTDKGGRNDRNRKDYHSI